MLFLMNLRLVCLWLCNVSRFLGVKGKHFSYENLLHMNYCSEENKDAIVHVKSVRYIYFEIEEVTKKTGKKIIFKVNT